MGKPKKGDEGKPAPPQPATDAAAEQPEKKKKNMNPGVRILGGRIYDSENGTSCHQCRQKTLEVKAKCTAAGCKLYFCPKCLENRYGEAVEEVNKTGSWTCPKCRKACNCSNCRKKQGLEATGQLAVISKTAGFGSVSALLQKNPKAKALAQMARDVGGKEKGSSSEPAGGAEGESAEAAPAKKKAPAKKRPVAELQDEAVLGERPCPLPEPTALAVHKAGGVAVPGARRARGPAWLSDVPELTALPEGEDAGELASVLEFVQVFAAPLKLKAPSLAALAAELLQPAAERQRDLLCSVPADSLVGQLHMRLIDMVREAWGFPTTCSPTSWQPIMLGYLQEAQQAQRGEGAGRPAELREGGRQPPAVAGLELLAGGLVAVSAAQAPVAPAAAEGEEGGAGSGEAGAAAAGLPNFPPGGYWGLAPAMRVAMLHSLAHDALDTYPLRNHIEGCMGDAMSEERERRTELAEVRKETKEAAQQQRNREIALLIANASEGLSVNDQRRLVEEARQRAEAAAAEKAAAKLKALSGPVHPPTVRAAPLGEERDGRRVYRLQAGPVLAGGDGVLVQQPGPEEGGRLAAPSAAGAATERWGAYVTAALPTLAAALEPRGRKEGPLRHALISAFKLPVAAVEAAEAAAGPGGKGATLSDGAAAAAGEEAAAAAAEPQQKPAGRGRKRVAVVEPTAAAAAAGEEAGAASKEGAAGRKRACGTPKSSPAAEAAGYTSPTPSAAENSRAGKQRARAASEQAAKPQAAVAQGKGAGRGKRGLEAGEPGGRRGRSRAMPLKLDDMLVE